MKKITLALAASATALTFMTAPVFADSIGSVEGARAMERSGRYLDNEEVDNLNKYGGNDDGYRSYGGYGGGGYGYYGGGYASPGISVYVGPRRGYGGYGYGPYGY